MFPSVVLGRSQTVAVDREMELIKSLSPLERLTQSIRSTWADVLG